MKKIFKVISALLIVVLVSCKTEKEIYVFTSFHEPATEGLRFLYSQDGINWDSIPGVWLKPEVGKHKVMRDPSIVRTSDGIFHLVWTSSWKGDLGFGYSSSKDLIEWSDQKFIPVMSHDTTTVNVWAPDLFYDDVKDSIMVVWASCVPYKFEKGEEEETNNHRLYYIKTKDFNTVTPTNLLYDPKFSVIDATILKREADDYVMVLKDNTRPNRNLKVAFAKSPEGPWSEASKSFTRFLTEGPAVAFVDSGYVIYYDEYREKRYGAAFTKDFINFEDITNKVRVPVGHKHGTIFKAPKSMIEQMLELKNGLHNNTDNEE
ncbi:glycoside hydrolase family 43 protein [Phocaeicola paurosaccharolyticus]|uniref:glycoside hydrolase family 43 protein n=1 Tax=Phocaeicola paurosaccharolyticus TaxID=732242 RepID=UPI00046A5157|nr:glycoside hydrolase family 43 protein [Phocaeicola paurosaccharolyticus]